MWKKSLALILRVAGRPISRPTLVSVWKPCFDLACGRPPGRPSRPDFLGSRAVLTNHVTVVSRVSMWNPCFDCACGRPANLARLWFQCESLALILHLAGQPSRPNFLCSQAALTSHITVVSWNPAPHFQTPQSTSSCVLTPSKSSS